MNKMLVFQYLIFLTVDGRLSMSCPQHFHVILDMITVDPTGIVEIDKSDDNVLRLMTSGSHNVKYFLNRPSGSGLMILRFHKKAMRVVCCLHQKFSCSKNTSRSAGNWSSSTNQEGIHK